MGFRRPRKPVIPGAPCPAERTSKVHDPAVTVTRSGPIVNRGVRTCGRCGREGVEVTQSLDTQGSRHRSPTHAPMTAWYYAPHDAPNRPICPQPCEHLSQEDAREGRTCPEHPCTCTDRPNQSEAER